VLGVHIVGPHATDLVGEGTLAVGVGGRARPSWRPSRTRTRRSTRRSARPSSPPPVCRSTATDRPPQRVHHHSVGPGQRVPGVPLLASPVRGGGWAASGDGQRLREREVGGVRLRLTAVLVAATAAVLAAGCADAGAEPVVEIDMEDNFFDRDITRIGEGEAVRFRNRGVVPHNAIDVDGAWSTGEALGGDRLDLLDPGEEVVLTFDEPGVYRFYCSLHAPDDGSSGMSATLVVGDVPFQAAGEAAPTAPVTEWTGVTRRVPEDHPTIQNAVDAAAPGDLVLISPAPETEANRADDGRYVYKEQVDIATPFLTVRGTDRNAVVIDGEHQRPIGINTVAADGVAVENLTVRNTTGNGIYWTAVRGYRGSHLTASNNAIYGIYAFDSTDGLFEHSYASGSKDAGFYVGQCDPCDAILTDVLAENNGMGYSGTNASEVFILDSVWRHNVSGIVPNTLDSQRLPPFGRVTIAGNLIHDNDSREAPALGLQWSAFGNGDAAHRWDGHPRHPQPDREPRAHRGHGRPEPQPQLLDERRQRGHRQRHRGVGLRRPGARRSRAPGQLLRWQRLPSTYFGIVGWLMPFSLFVAWVALTMIDVARREDLTPAGKAGWTVGALLVPFAGAAAYLLAGRPTFPAWQRWLMVVGAVVVIVVVTLVSVIVGGLL
jgi:plastocyanin